MSKLSATVVYLSLLAVPSGLANAETIKIGGSGAGLGLLRVLGEAYEQQQPGTIIEVAPSLGSSGGISAVAAGAIDLGISGRPLNAKEVSPKLTQRAFADSPFLFVTSHRKATAIGLPDLLKIYRGETTTWPDGSPLRIVLRPKSDAASLFMSEKLEGMAAALEVSRARQEISVAPTDQDNLEMADRLAGSLAVMTLVQFRTEPNKLKPILLNGVSPTTADGPNLAYPLRYRLFLILPASPAPTTARFVAFLASDTAGQIIHKHGGFPVHEQ